MDLSANNYITNDGIKYLIKLESLNLEYNTKITDFHKYEGLLTRSNYDVSFTDVSPAFNFEDFIKNTQLILEEVLEFLGINKKIEFELEPKNQYRIPKGGIAELLFADSKIRKIIKKSIPVNMRIRFGEKYLLKKEIRPTIDLETKKILDDIYSEDINKLSNLLNRELKWKPFQKD